MLVLITGGSASGKSEMAEGICQRLNAGRMVYIATMIPYGEEGRAIVARHRSLRVSKGFDTLERCRDLEGIDCDGYHTALLECMSNLVANEMFEEKTDGDEVVFKVMQGVQKLRESVELAVIVSNEVFNDGVAYAPETMAYMEALGRVNCEIAGLADTVIESVYGLPVVHKQGSAAEGWGYEKDW